MAAEPFEFSDEAYDKARELMSELLTQAYNKDYPVAPVDDMLELLQPYIQQAMAAEYDRGYETALRLETDLQKDAWDEGFSEGTGYGAYLEGGYGYYPTPVNPYLHYPAADGSVTPQTPPTTG